MPSIKGYRLRDLLINGTIDATGLESLLSTSPDDFSAFCSIVHAQYAFEPLANISNGFSAVSGSPLARGIILAVPDSIRVLANSDYATEQLCKDSDSVLILAGILNDTSGSMFAHWRDYVNNYNRIKKWVNASGSKLKRQIFNTSGTWTAPVSSLAWSAASVGNGGGGFNGSNGGGGSGGEIKTINNAGPVNTNQSVTIPSAATAGNNGAAVTVGSILSAAGGVVGASSGYSAGGGATTNGGLNNMDYDFGNAPWQSMSASQKGGDGGANTNLNPNMGDGRDGTPNSAGSSGFSNPNTLCTSGGKYSGGGGGTTSPVGSLANALPNTGAGGACGRSGGTGVAVIHHLEA